MHQPHPINIKIKRVSRLVILPDYQGIGLGTKLLNFIAEIYNKQNYDFSIVTSAKNLINALRKSNKWCMSRYGVKKGTISDTAKIDSKRKLRDCKTATFFYKG